MDETEGFRLIQDNKCCNSHELINCGKDNILSNKMASYDVEGQNDRQTSKRRVMRYIPEVTADNLSARIRLEPRHLGNEFERRGSYRNSQLPPGAPGQVAVNKIASDVQDRRNKIKLKSSSGDVSEINFANSVRSGNERRVNALLKTNKESIENHLLAKLSFDLTLDRDTSLDQSPSDEADGGVPDVDKVSMTVTVFQLGIIAKRAGMIKLFMEKVLDITEGDERVSFFTKLLGAQAHLEFPKNNPKFYDKDDRSLDGMNAFHLGAKYSPGALTQIFDYLNENMLMEEYDIKELLEATDAHIYQTPLHIAAAHPAGSGYSRAARLLIENGANVNAVNYQGFTPLHVASKYGNDNIVAYLLENDADPSMAGHRLKTPLHKAKTAKTVQILLNNGANPYAKATGKTDVDGHPTQSVFDTLLYRHAQATLNLMTECIDTNGQDLDSSDLLVVYDLEIFHHESLRGEDMEPDETAAHKKILSVKDDSILQHPLSELMLYLKKYRIAKFYNLNLITYGFFLLSFTTLVLMQTMWLKDFDQYDIDLNNGNSIHNKCRWNGTWDAIFDGRCNFWYNADRRENLTGDDGIKCGLIFLNEWNKTNESVSCDENLSHPSFYAFYTFYFWSVLATGLLVVKEILQIFYNWDHYWTSVEEFLEIGQYILAVGYLVGMFFFSRLVNLHLAALSILLVWFDMTLLLGRIPAIGIYVYMWTHVMKTMVKVLVVFLPTLLAFSFSFYVLLPTNPAFNDPITSILKSIAMMTGELEFGDTFTIDSSKEKDDSTVTLQLVFILFVFLITIIIANLIIGLTVSEIDVLYSEARAIRLEKMVRQLVNLEDMFINKPSVTDYMPSSVKDKAKYVTRIFPYLEKLKFTKDNKTIKGSSTSHFKICVRPFRPISKTNTTVGFVAWILFKFFKKTKFSTDNRIYFYDEVKGGIGTDIGYAVPGHIVTNTLKLLEERENRVVAQIMLQEQNAESMKAAEKSQSTNAEALDNMTPNTRRKKSMMPNKPVTPALSRRNSLLIPTLEANMANAVVDGTQKKPAKNLNFEDISSMKELMLQMIKTIDDMENKTEEKEASQL